MPDAEGALPEAAYVVRLVAYVVLIAAIVEKNRVKQATR